MPRIIAGAYGGRRLVVASDATRPTSDRVREALFAALDARVDLTGMTVLDLFAGTGALGLEALSRGAASATFVDEDRRAVGGLRANIAACGAGEKSTVARRDATEFLRSAPGQRYDMIFCDPPYDLPDPALTDILALAGPMLGDGYFVLERAKRSKPPSWPPTLSPVLDKVYGDTRVAWAQPSQTKP
ncbi:hypothetical protein GOARA_063_01870 [Gordonia araii NBRC 100433]|uniref:Methyltransferase n=1 Tax=Gordonia araii NBRC 100433 TaxID=1073574 RepID=G7H563_9ACTN|nr:16S rRNA (guanine(966)-N(2))-methyltransferase RsmD [Gordonia araii]NNG96678.1 16S rRNA (guanine(966)-N(2))-methyltransferase RsmD [Gordonia araii NBRC 100433]GAB10988.1 hypothetical protein GOARA_063_01870 [Gordonia araii NBRC 100433]